MPICLHCKATVTDDHLRLSSPGEDITRCPECNQPGLYRGQVDHDFVVYGTAIWGCTWETALYYTQFTPTELRLIADDLEEQERTG